MAEQVEADVCLLLEGTYPYVSGGVSEWTHNLINAMPDINFTAVCIVPSRAAAQTLKYDLPDNLRDVQLIPLHEESAIAHHKPDKKGRKEIMEIVRSFHNDCAHDQFSHMDQILGLFQESGKGLCPHDLIFGRDVWDFLIDQYQPEENQESFIDYFWTFRTTHMPIFKLLSSPIPSAKIYHSVSTGYAGLLGVMAQQVQDRPLLLTEHGLYSRERKIDIIQTKWVQSGSSKGTKIRRDPGEFQQIWIRLFQQLGKMAYRKANQILTICEVNREQQILQGADPQKTVVIPNGINVEKFGSFYAEKMEQDWDQKRPYSIGFVGRIVPIKDVKTFIRSCRIVSQHLPGLQIFIMGPTEEDPAYFRECQELAQTLGLADSVIFTGTVNVLDYFPRLDLVVLTSVSEGQPLIILEANCAGIPVVASDVGACKEMLAGHTKEDKKLGMSGLITGVSDPAETSQAIITILTNNELRRKMGESGHLRVKTFYSARGLHRKYHQLYKELCDYLPPPEREE